MKPKRLLSFALSLAMVLGMFPGTALGANADNPKTTTITQETTTGGTLTMTLTIAPKSLEGATVTLDNTQLTYNGSEQTVNVSEVKLNDKTLTANDYEVTSGNKGTNVGEYTLTITGKGNYTGTATATWKIVAKDMTASAENVSVNYDGQPHGITVNVTDPASGADIKYGNAEGTYDLDASPTITNVNESPITVYYKVTAANYNEKTGSATVTINKANQTAPAAPTMASSTVNSVTLNTITNGEYSKDGISWQESPTFTGLTMNTSYTFYQRLKEDTNHNASPASSAANISTSNHAHNWSYQASGATITATCGNTDGGHDGELTTTLTVVKPAKTTYGDSNSAEATVTGSIPGVATPTVLYKKGNNTLGQAPTDAGTYTANITLDGKTASVDYTIAKANATVTAPTAKTLTYNGSDQALVTEGSSTDGQVQYSLSENGTYNTGIPTGKDAKAYTVWYKVVGDDNHNDTAPAKVDVTIAQKEVGLNWGENSFTYNGQEQAPTASATNLEAADEGKVSVTVEGAQTNASDTAYTATASELTGERASNYKLPSSKTKSFTIAKAAPTLSSISAGAITYGQALSASTVSGTATGVNNEEVTGTWAWTTSTTKPAVSDSDATQYDVTFTSSDSNYNNATGKATLTVNPKVLTLSWGTDSFTYDKQSHAPTASADNLEAADEGKVSVTVEGAQTNARDTAYTATASELSGDSAANYTLPAAKTKTFTIAKKEVGLNWANTSFTYDGQAHAPTASATGVESGDTCTVTVTGAQTNAGENYTATATSLSNSNYKLPSEVTQNFTIAPKAITATADNKSTSYKNNLAALTFTLSDGALAQGDSEASLKITASTEATKDSPKGTYPITLAKGQDSNPNYNVTLVPGTYTISEADATITASAYNGTYDGQEHSITVTVKDEAHNIVDLVKQLFGQNNTPEATVYYSTVSVEDALTQKNTTAPTRKDVGETTVYYAVEFGGNYKAEPPVTGSQKVAITAKEVGLSWSNTSFTYDSKSHIPSATATELVGNDTCTVTVEGAQTSAGTYTATATSLSNSNYKLPSANTTSFTISTAASSATAPTAKSLTYNGQNQALVNAGSASGGTMVYSLNQNSNYSATLPTGQDAKSYTVWYKVSGDSNHSDTTPASVSVSIAPKEVTLTWSNTSFTYDGKAHAPVATAGDLVKDDKCDVTVEGEQTNVGSYTATATNLSNVNYKLPSNVQQSFTINKAEQSAPAAPKVSKTTTTSITVKANSGEEYSLDGKTWQKSGTFKGLQAGKSYKVYARKAESANYKVSPASKATQVQTKNNYQRQINTGLKLTQTKNQLNVKWGKVDDANRYEVYATYCGKALSKKPTLVLKSNKVNTATITKLNGKKLIPTKQMRVVVVAKKGSKVLAKSMGTHVVGRKNKKLTNVKSVKLNKNAFTIKKGKTAQIKGTVTLADKKRSRMPDKHVAKFRFLSYDKSVATVDKNGKITAKGTGKCVIHVFAHNGLTKKVTVTVK